MTDTAVAVRQSSLQEMQAFAEAACQSKFYGFTNPAQMLPLMIVAQSQGRSFASVVEEYSIIQGRPALKAEAMLSRFQRAGGHIKWMELSDERCAAVFSHASCDPVEIDWDLDRAKQAGILGNAMWKKYPRNMLKARVISDGVRTAFPACLGGMYCPEEVQDFEPLPAAVTHSPRPAALAAPTDAGQHEEQSGPSLSVSFTTDKNDDQIGKGKSAYQSRKDGDWERVSDRLLGEMHEFRTRPELLQWWSDVVTNDEEYKAFPSTWRQTFKEEYVMPHMNEMPEVMGA